MKTSLSEQTRQALYAVDDAMMPHLSELDRLDAIREIVLEDPEADTGMMVLSNEKLQRLEEGGHIKQRF